MLTPEQREKMGKRHHERPDYSGMQSGPRPGDGRKKDGMVPYCAGCGQVWPCDAARLLEHIKAMEERYSVATAALERIGGKICAHPEAKWCSSCRARSALAEAKQ